MSTYEPWQSVNGTVTSPADEPKHPWDGDKNGPERPYMRDYTKILTIKIMLAYQDMQDRTKSEVLLKFDEVIERIKEIDKLTLGIPKLVYLVGWNGLGHDDKFPSWDIVNQNLCDEGENPVEKLRWVMREAVKYNTTVSLHINSNDVYMDSPLWDYCEQNDLITKRDGKLYMYAQWQGKDTYLMNFKKSWESGFYKKQVDGLLAMLPELKLAGSIHSDAFLCRWSDQSTYEEEQAARRQMIRYWRDCGMDLTSEFIYGTTEHKDDEKGDERYGINGNNAKEAGLIGLMPYAWHLAQTEEWWFRRPQSLLAAGGIPHYINPLSVEEDYERLAFLYGNTMQGEDILAEDCRKVNKENTPPEWDIRFKNSFYTTTALYVYMNRFKNINTYKNGDETVLNKEDGLTCVYAPDGDRRRVTHNGRLIRRDNDVFVPVCWIEKFPAVAAFSEKGYKNMKWTLSDEWGKTDTADIYDISKKGLEFMTSVKISDGLELSLHPCQAVLIVPAGNKI